MPQSLSGSIGRTRARDLDAPGVDLAGQRRDRIGERHIDVAALDVIGGERDLRALVVGDHLDAGLVDAGAGQFQRVRRAMTEKMPAAAGS